MTSRRRLSFCAATLGVVVAGACATQETDVGEPNGTGATSFGASGGTDFGGSGGSGGVGATGGAGGTIVTGGTGALGGSGGTDASPSDGSPDASIDAPADVVSFPDVIEAGDGAVASGLSGQRLELPCGSIISSNSCSAGVASIPLLFEGDAGAAYDVTIRIRGVVEFNSYSGGTANGTFYVGGVPSAGGWNVFSIDVSSPKQTYYLNGGGAGTTHCFAIDYTRTIKIAAGALVVLSAETNDSQEVRNFDDQGKPIVVPDIPPAPNAFDGQFVQIDVVSVAPG